MGGLGLGFCCCPAACKFFEDPFDRTDRTDIGAPWLEIVGEWTIVNQSLRVGSANARIDCDLAAPGGASTVRVSAYLWGGTAGDQLRVYVNDGAQYAEIEVGDFTALSLGWLRFYDGADLVASCRVATYPANGIAVYVCCSADRITITASGAPVLCVPIVVASSKCGLGTGNLGALAAIFDTFILEETSDADAACVDCGKEPCIICAPCSTPWKIRVLIENILSTGYVTCPETIDVETLPVVGEVCAWFKYTIVDGIWWTVRASLAADSPFTALTVTVTVYRDGSLAANFVKAIVMGTPDCMAIDGAIPFVSGTTCDWTAAICTIDAQR